jgi:phenylacetate-CoA ligase
MSRFDTLQKSQWQSEEQRYATQARRLQALLEHAFEHSPYYQSLAQRLDIHLGDSAPEEILKQFPVTRKMHIREHWAQLQADNFKAGDLIESKTGGSTGMALKLRFDRRCEAYRNAAALRSDIWGGFRPGMRRGALWGGPPTAVTWRQKIRAQLHDRTFYLDTIAMDEPSIERFAQQWLKLGGQALFGHAHSIYMLAVFLEDMAIDWIRPQAIISTSMMLLQPERQVIERVLQCPVQDRYGCEEVGLIASQCERFDLLHVNEDDLVVEVLGDDDTPVALGETGRVIVTDLNNYGMPLLRYQVEDMAQLALSSCGCGRKGLQLERVIGRVADFLYRADGRLVAGVSIVERTLTEVLGISQMQLIQHELLKFSINLVVDASFGQASELELVARLQAIFGTQCQFELNRVERLSQTSSGKYRFAICKLDEIRKDDAEVIRG